MENDQAAHLRAMVRHSRLVAAVDSGPPRLLIVSLEGMAPRLEATSFASDLTTAAAKRDVRLAFGDESHTEADWVYDMVIPPATCVDDACLARSCLVLALAETTPSAVLATYALLKQLHSLGSRAAIEVVFAGEPEGAERASQGLRGTCRRFLGWDALGSSHWLCKGGGESLQGLAERLARLAELSPIGNSGVRNSLAPFPLEPV